MEHRGISWHCNGQGFEADRPKIHCLYGADMAKAENGNKRSVAGAAFDYGALTSPFSYRERWSSLLPVLAAQKIWDVEFSEDDFPRLRRVSRNRYLKELG
jgi:hypothetical protein